VHGTQFVNHPLGLFPSIVQQTDVCRIGDICWRTGGIDDELAFIGNTRKALQTFRLSYEQRVML